MGEQFLADQAKRFKVQSDEAFRKELKSRNLFSDRPEVFETDFSCRLVDMTVCVCPGDLVVIRKKEDTLEIISENLAIGAVNPDAAGALVEAMTVDQRCSGFASASVVESSSIGGRFTVRITRDRRNAQ